VTDVVLRTVSGNIVRAGARLGSGGEGEVFAVGRGMVLKKYLPKTLADDPALERRLRVMVAYPPTGWRETGGHVTLAWPSQVVRADGRFAGFLMPAVDMADTVELHRITNADDRGKATGATAWIRGFTWRYLVRTAANLSQAVHALHQAGVVIGDFNERNVRVTRDTRVTLLDCDSMQVTDPASRDRFFCRVGRPEFTPPELARANWKTTVRHPSSDLFALAIHIYQLLLEGEHPFRGKWSGPGEKPREIELARDGTWAHQRNGQLRPRPSAIGISLLPDYITAMFRSAFEAGAVNPGARPTALQWHRALLRLEESLQRCTTNPKHYYPGANRACPWCKHRPHLASSTRRPLPLATTPTPNPGFLAYPPTPTATRPAFVAASPPGSSRRPRITIGRPARMPARRALSARMSSATVRRWRRAETWMRRHATAGILSAAHFALVTTAIVLLLAKYSWGRTLIDKAYHQRLGSQVSGWYTNSLIHTAASWANSLPWGGTDLFYSGLAMVCLLTYFFRWPGWITLLISVISAAYGILAAVSLIPFFVPDWPVTAGAVAISWIVLRRARRRARRFP
jgi:hypothetical protein